MTEINRELKSEIVLFNREIARGEIKLTGLNNLKDSLRTEIDYLEEMESEIRLKNYELRCEMLANGGNQRNQTNYYDSQQDIVLEEEMGYEEMMELRDRFGVVPLGYDDKKIKSLRGEIYLPIEDQEEQQCCICC